MKESIKAIQCHMIKTAQSHWCKYWKDKSDGTKLYNEDNHFPEVFMAELDPIFEINDSVRDRIKQFIKIVKHTPH